MSLHPPSVETWKPPTPEELEAAFFVEAEARLQEPLTAVKGLGKGTGRPVRASWTNGAWEDA